MQRGELEASVSSNSLALGCVFIPPVSEGAGAALRAVCASLFITGNRSSGKRPSPRHPGWPALVWSVCCAAFLIFFVLFLFSFFFSGWEQPPSESGRENNPAFAWWSRWMKGPSCLIPIMSRDVKAAQKLHTQLSSVRKRRRKRCRARDPSGSYLTVWQTH